MKRLCGNTLPELLTHSCGSRPETRKSDGAKIVGAAPGYDLAALKIHAPEPQRGCILEPRVAKLPWVYGSIYQP